MEERKDHFLLLVPFHFCVNEPKNARDFGHSRQVSTGIDDGLATVGKSGSTKAYDDYDESRIQVVPREIMKQKGWA
ncbi:unnamed protein product [Protopolystoma xenopodis]|uniref:Uncharacterized protein n=1 Tax=Protopolystoma xenopodis TaxID=117903 RepID=A0A448XRU9_9PLAT|nr:unnamed protein product [Protopolystoma xenopodis]